MPQPQGSVGLAACVHWAVNRPTHRYGVLKCLGDELIQSDVGPGSESSGGWAWVASVQLLANIFYTPDMSGRHARKMCRVHHSIQEAEPVVMGD